MLSSSEWVEPIAKRKCYTVEIERFERNKVAQSTGMKILILVDIYCHIDTNHSSAKNFLAYHSTILWRTSRTSFKSRAMTFENALEKSATTTRYLYNARTTWSRQIFCVAKSVIAQWHRLTVVPPWAGFEWVPFPRDGWATTRLNLGLNFKPPAVRISVTKVRFWGEVYKLERRTILSSDHPYESVRYVHIPEDNTRKFQ